MPDVAVAAIFLSSRAESVMNTPILISGAHRSGTTWIGKVLAQAPNTIYLHEPFSPVKSEPGVCAYRFPFWYTYIDDLTGSRALRAALARMFEPRYELLDRFSSLALPIHPRIIWKRWRSFAEARATQATIIMKDPFALLAVPWLASVFGVRPVIVIRHPAAFASSLKVKGWHCPFRDLAVQRELMSTYSVEERAEITRVACGERDIIEGAALLWRILYGTVARYRQQYPSWLFVKHEDLSARPFELFSELFQQLRLDYSPLVELFLSQTLTRRDRAYVAHSTAIDDVCRDTASNVTVWRERLTPAEVQLICERTRGVWEQFYSEDSWCQPQTVHACRFA
jgi:hypothetical protein